MAMGVQGGEEVSGDISLLVDELGLFAEDVT